MLLVAVAANIIGIIFMQFSTDLMAYHFFIIGMLIVIAVQYVWIMKFFKQRIKIHLNRICLEFGFSL